MKQPAHDLHLCMVSPSAAHCSFNATLQDALPSCVVLPCPSVEAAQAAVHDLVLLHSAARCVDTAGRSAKLGQDERRLLCTVPLDMPQPCAGALPGLRPADKPCVMQDPVGACGKASSTAPQ